MRLMVKSTGFIIIISSITIITQMIIKVAVIPNTEVELLHTITLTLIKRYIRGILHHYYTTVLHQYAVYQIRKHSLNVIYFSIVLKSRTNNLIIKRKSLLSLSFISCTFLTFQNPSRSHSYEHKTRKS